MPESIPQSSPSMGESLPHAPAITSVSQGERGDSPDTGRVYKPLSLLAIVGFCLALPYALFISAGALIALYVGSPYLLGGLTAILPIAAAVLCGIALVRINRSEGTLGGARLAIWGLRLSLLFGLGYWAYFIATFFAIRQQADEFSQKWLQKIANGQLDSAFLLIIDPKNKPPKENPAYPNDPAIRDQIEKRFNSGGGADPRGMYSRFPEQDIVRFMRLMSKDIKVEFLGSSQLEYKDGYTVGLRYRLVGKEGSVNIKVTVQGVEGDEDSPSGRRWFVRLEQSGIDGKPELNFDGQRKMAICMASKQFLQEWLKYLAEGHYDRAYLDTLDPKDFEQKSVSLFKAYLPLLTTTPTYSNVPAGALASYLTSYLAYNSWEKQAIPDFPKLLKGALIQPSPNGYSIPDKEFGQMVLQDVKERFRHPDQDFVPTLKIDQTTLPLVKEEEDKLLLELDFTMGLMSKRIMVDGVFIVECDKDIGENGKLFHYRLKSIDLRRARTVELGGNLMKIPLGSDKPVPADVQNAAPPKSGSK
ncbi:MAG TPA: hypothetical protein VGZ25_01350 [Gemmataceae bacterium]|jgi:hypothetical protein|nr:hypothetical protein [Gemmataceae bacterium]